MDDLLAEFVAETREMLSALGSELVAWEADPEDRERLDQIFRFAHTVKGNCGFFDFPRLERLSHAAEEALDQVRRGQRSATPQLVSAILSVMDRISDHIDAIDAGEELAPGPGDQLIAALAADDGEGGVAVLQAKEIAQSEPAADNGSGITANDTSEEADAEVARTRTPTVQRSIRLPVDLLDRLMSGISDLVLARNHLGRSLREMGGSVDLDGPFERMSTILDDVRDAMTRMRMQRIGYLLAAMPRLVRDLGQELDKQVMIDLEGEDVELDREMIETIRDPLTHLIRNAMDHGFETAQERRAAGKREIGTLQIAARQSGNQIYLTVRDDGRGIDTQRLCTKALAAGIVTEKQLSTMSDTEKNALIFHPGLSTADTVTAVSGRGVGMDVVRANIEKVGGTIELVSKAGTGTVVYLRLPLTLSIIDTLSVSNAGQRFAMPRNAVEEVMFSGDDDLGFTELGDRRFVDFRGRRIPCLFLSEVLGVPTDVAPTQQTYIVVRYSRRECIAFGVDGVHDHEEAVIKPIAPALSDTGIYIGATLLNDGTPVLALDMASIGVASGLLRLDGGGIAADDDAGSHDGSDIRDASDDEKTGYPAMMLFVGFDGEQRCLPMADLERIETIDGSMVERHGGENRAVIDGGLHRLSGMDAASDPPAKLRLLKMRSDGQDAFHAIRAIIDVVEAESELFEDEQTPGVRGYVVIGGKPVPVVDVRTIAERGQQPQTVRIS